MEQMEKLSHFIIVDDDTINNTLCSVIIRKIIVDAEIKTFNMPEEGFNYILNQCSCNNETTILFLDINMPGWTGWMFLEHFEELDEKIKKEIKIYMLSSSVDPQDMERAKAHKNVVDFVVKPLTKSKVLDILHIY
jgi:two-component SAPR family response regulator